MRSAAAETAIRWSFYALIPGFFAYHFLVASAWLPPVLGGYSSAMAALVLLPLGGLYAKRVLGRLGEFNAVDAAFLAFIAYYALVMLLHMALGSRTDAAREHFGVIVQFLSLFFVLRLLPFEDVQLSRWLLVILLAMGTTIAFNADEGTFVVATLDLLRSADHFANYQAYAFVFVVTLLLVISPMQRVASRLLVYALATPVLFLNGARTEFVGFLLLVLVLEFMLSRHKSLMLLVAALAVLLGVLSLPLLAELFPESRTVFLFLEFSEDKSANERTQMLSFGLQTIMDSPWLGALGSHAPGEHIHNGLSAWVDLGLPGFLAFALLILIPTLDVCFFRARQLHVPAVRLAFCLLMLTALFSLTAKHYTHQLLPLALAAYARLFAAGARHVSMTQQPQAALA